jgi:hypothetical protein
MLLITFHFALLLAHPLRLFVSLSVLQQRKEFYEPECKRISRRVQKTHI